MTFQVHSNDIVPLGLAHIEHNPVAYEAGIAHQDVELAELFDGLVDHVLSGFPIGDVVEIGNGTPTTGDDLGRCFACGPGIGPGTIPFTT